MQEALDRDELRSLEDGVLCLPAGNEFVVFDAELERQLGEGVRGQDIVRPVAFRLIAGILET